MNYHKRVRVKTMAKKGVIMFYDLLEQLEDFTDEQFGMITRAIIKYDRDNVVPEFTDTSVKVAFKMIKPIIDKNKQEYENKCEKNRENVKKRWEKQDTNEYDCIRMNTNYTDIDNDIDNDNNKKKNIKRTKTKSFVPPTLQDIIDYANSRHSSVDAKKFYDYFTADEDINKHWIDSNGKKVKNWKQKFITWESHSPKEKNQNFTGRQYSKEDWRKLYQNIDEIEV